VKNFRHGGAEIEKTLDMGWPSGIGLGPGSVLLLKVSGSILSDANMRGLV